MTNISNLCRVCLDISSPKISLSSEFDERHTVRNCFRDFLGISMSEDPRLPQQICVECLDRVSDARKFHMQCQDAENKLKLRFGIHKSEAEPRPTPQDRPDTPKFEEVAVEKLLEVNEDLFEDLDDLESVDCDSDQDMEYETFTHMAEDGTEVNEENLENLEPDDHQNNVAEEPSFQCTRCNEQFKHKRNLQLHDFYAHDIKPDRSIKMFQCEECNVSFSMFCRCTSLTDYEQNYKIHMKRHHVVELNESCVCPECGNSFESTQLMNKHYKAIHHESGNAPANCTVCDKVVKRKHLTSHMRTHTGEKPYECQYCLRRFLHSSSWKSHLSTHEGFTISCDYPGCTKMFTRNSIMRRHVRIVHHRERPYVCDIPGCEKDFNHSQRLRNHKEDSHGQAPSKPLQCAFCDKSFTRTRFLEKHIKIVHKRKPYQCPYCEKAFLQPKMLMTHTASKHDYAMSREEASTHRD